MISFVRLRMPGLLYDAFMLYDLCGNHLLKEQYRNESVDVTEGYRYNERNELTERVRAGSLTRYRYDRNGSIISEEEAERRSEYRYDLLNRQIYVRTPDGAYHAYHQDEQGSTAYITGQGRTAENIYQYDAFGNLTEQKEDITNRILYTGQQYDQETGQYYLRARYYNPVVGRFLQEDTYRGDGLNLYAYCANNPVMYYDPSGQAGTTTTPVCGNGSNNAPGNTRGAETGNSKSTISDESKSKWGKGTFDTVEDSLNYHYGEHGQEVGAGDIDQYVRKADGFRQNLRGSQKARPTNGTPGAIRYTKNGKYIIDPDGKILSFGKER